MNQQQRNNLIRMGVDLEDIEEVDDGIDAIDYHMGEVDRIDKIKTKPSKPYTMQQGEPSPLSISNHQGPSLPSNDS